MKKILIYILLSIILSIGLNNASIFAQADEPESSGPNVIAPSIPKPDYLPGPSTSDIAEQGGERSILVETILPFFAVGFVGFIGGISIIFLIIAGIRYVTSYGNEEAIEKAKEQVKWALIGLVVAILSWTIVVIITNFQFEPRNIAQ